MGDYLLLQGNLEDISESCIHMSTVNGPKGSLEACIWVLKHWKKDKRTKKKSCFSTGCCILWDVAFVYEGGTYWDMTF